MIKAIETMYNGYRFRSRLEARWAVYFDAVTDENKLRSEEDKKIPMAIACLITNGFDFSWEYEKEGFDLNGIWYLPDFYFKFGAWAEIKPEPFTDKQEHLCVALAKATQKPCFMLEGTPDDRVYHPIAWLDEKIYECAWLHSRYAYYKARSARFEHGAAA